MSGPASITIRRRIEWVDTDAAGVYHWLTAFRLVEAAEAELHDRLGIRSQTFGRMPRATVSADFRRVLRFFDAADVQLRVIAVGRTSVTYDFSIYLAGEVAVDGTFVAVLVDPGFTGGAVPLPETVRRQLQDGGAQAAQPTQPTDC